MKTQLKRELKRRSACSPRVASPIRSQFISEFERWYDSSGPEWAINRVKSFKTDLIRLHAGLDPCSTWIEKVGPKKFGGVFGAIQKTSFRSEDHFRDSLQLLNLTSMFYAPSITKSQRDKFINGVFYIGPSVQNDVIDQGIQNSSTFLRKCSERYLSRNYPRLIDYSPSPSKRAPLLDRSVPEKYALWDSIEFLYANDQAENHMAMYSEYYRRVFAPFSPRRDEELDRLIRSRSRDKSESMGLPGGLPVGRIGLIQEPGYKLRAVANPGRCFQHVTKPVGSALYSIVSTLPWDCTFDQQKGLPFVMAHLKEGKRSFCYDLSGATDHFPWEWQRFVLSKLVPDFYVPLIEDLCKGLWFFEPENRWISWSTGQPLGLFPSFALFTLTHGLLLNGLLNEPYNNQFFVLGDDVIILDPDLAKKYSDCLANAEIPISESKSIDSDNIAEFAGAIILKSSFWRLGKWRNLSDENFIEIARTLGEPARLLMRTKQRHYYDLFSPIPECLGGLGRNPLGLPLESRIPLWLFDDPLPKSPLMSYTSIQHSNMYCSEYLSNTSDILSDSLMTDLEQKSVGLLQNNCIPFSPEIGPVPYSKNLDEVSMGNHGLPLEGGGKSRTFLDRLSSKVWKYSTEE